MFQKLIAETRNILAEDDKPASASDKAWHGDDRLSTLQARAHKATIAAGHASNYSDNNANDPDHSDAAQQHSTASKAQHRVIRHIWYKVHKGKAPPPGSKYAQSLASAEKRKREHRRDRERHADAASDS